MIWTAPFHSMEVFLILLFVPERNIPKDAVKIYKVQIQFVMYIIRIYIVSSTYDTLTCDTAY